MTLPLSPFYSPYKPQRNWIGWSLTNPSRAWSPQPWPPVQALRHGSLNDGKLAGTDLERVAQHSILLMEARKKEKTGKWFTMIYCMIVYCPIFKAILLYTREPERCPGTIWLVSKHVTSNGIKLWIKTVKLQHITIEEKLELASVDVPRRCGFLFAGAEPKQGGNPPAWGVCRCNHRVCSACLVACAPHGYDRANSWGLLDKDFHRTWFTHL